MAEASPRSPQWSQSTKLVVTVLILVIVGALVVRFNNIIGPLLLAFILSYLLHPLTRRLSERSNLSWRGSVNLIFIIFLLVISFVFTVTGFAIVEQLENLVRVVQSFVANLPQLAQDLSTQVYHVGPFEFDFAELETQLQQNFDLSFLALGEQLLGALQPVLGGAGSLLGSLATSALSALGWGAFVIIISYFILADAGQVPDFFIGIDMTGHSDDLRTMAKRLGRIWNAFLRGQLLLFIMIVLSSFLLMTLLGVRNALGLAFLAGLAKFVPYVGPLIAGITNALVAFFQGGNYLGIGPPLTYALIVVVAAVVLDQIFDNLVTPRIYGSTLGVHPAAVLVAAIIALNLLGFVGLLVAAPVLASLQLFLRYVLRKMLDLDPWETPSLDDASMSGPWSNLLQRTNSLLRSGWQKTQDLVRSRRSK